MSNTVFSIRLKNILLEKGIKQVDFAKKCFASKTTVSRWVHGTQIPDDTTIAFISNLLGERFEYLKGVDDFRTVEDVKKYETIKILTKSQRILKTFNPLEDDILKITKEIILEKKNDLKITIPSKEYNQFLRYIRLSFLGAFDIYINQMKEDEAENEKTNNN